MALVKQGTYQYGLLSACIAPSLVLSLAHQSRLDHKATGEHAATDTCLPTVLVPEPEHAVIFHQPRAEAATATCQSCGLWQRRRGCRGLHPELQLDLLHRRALVRAGRRRRRRLAPSSSLLTGSCWLSRGLGRRRHRRAVPGSCRCAVRERLRTCYRQQTVLMGSALPTAPSMCLPNM